MPAAVVYAVAYTAGQAVAAYTGIAFLGTLVTFTAVPAIGGSNRRRATR